MNSNFLPDETRDLLKDISLTCLTLTCELRQAKNKKDLIQIGKSLSKINYSLLYIVKEIEMEAVEMLFEDTTLEEDEN